MSKRNTMLDNRPIPQCLITRAVKDACRNLGLALSEGPRPVPGQTIGMAKTDTVTWWQSYAIGLASR